MPEALPIMLLCTNSHQTAATLLRIADRFLTRQDNALSRLAVRRVFRNVSNCDRNRKSNLPSCKIAPATTRASLALISSSRPFCHVVQSVWYCSPPLVIPQHLPLMILCTSWMIPPSNAGSFNPFPATIQDIVYQSDSSSSSHCTNTRALSPVVFRLWFGSLLPHQTKYCRFA